ncbi:radical SAM/SPASM domain-containing protein [Edaphocola flava]|uniref:radical SAM/SPASM domain-containing protein n=1 Tax=Edaphocola flava TaxID=2499629 RepID=UPI00100AFB81|nr:radical SAM protein [Edaphocola flava]
MMQYKKSYYFIKGNVLVGGKYEIIYSTLSNKLYALDQQIGGLIEEGQFEQIPENILNKLVEDKFIRLSETNELQEHITVNKQAIDNDSYTLYQSIQPSANCQLGCSYCGQSHNKKTMGFFQEEAILSRVVHNLTKKEYKALGICWFGGEPLMGIKSIRSLSNRFQDLCNEQQLDYSAKIVTNGLSLKREIFFDLLLNHKVDEFEITLDGTATYHDQRRHTKEGNHTFDIILNNLKSIVNDERFAQHKPTLIIRSNIDKNNYESITELVELLEQENIFKYAKFYLAPIHSWGNDAHFTSLSDTEFADIELEMKLQLLAKGYPIQFVPGQQKNIVCMSLKDNAELFDAEGNLFNCSEVSQVPVYENNNNQHRIAQYTHSSNELIDETFRPFSNWNDTILKGEVPCSTCKILPICGGQCPKLWHEGIQACPSVKFNFPDRIVAQFYANNMLDANKNEMNYLSIG